MSSPTNARRQFLKLGAGTAGLFGLSQTFSQVLAASCGPTPPQTSGPFYPGGKLFETETDLTQVPGHTQRAQGQVVTLRGRVVDPGCNPVAGANVEIWQACASGRYNNAKDPNPAPLDPHFKYWAETFTDNNGEYSFKTVIPGAYPADKDWERPPHIHFRVSCLGYRELTTQMYFKGEPLNDRDLILQDLPANERANVIIDFSSLTGQFDITLRPVRPLK